ncbi:MULTISPECIES: DUF692 domain-containing protein [unclassified Wenzhouxiangella]|uniref:HvfB family MNIO-type RiPP peptide maturase n=1 Tax=unclassified Wenzhouxiangella TaxID=2613841 RepID=UPI000E3277E2|nr:MULTISPECIES: DUF692 domain-containing protein [unclassified Wenzhouxiangella]RFF28936.1 DUF692 domain-containing protein [Wenzhouxiangella sp. 15181]RFP68355.1 DUF692 domain-containing protein [Wenzhouxiangella sp. 15190]
MSRASTFDLKGAGLGLRRGLLEPLREADLSEVGFMEVAPENWIGVGGRLGRRFAEYTERFPFVCHGLSLSLGAPEPLDRGFLERVRRFLDQHGIRGYSEHLSYCSEHGHLYDLMPIPFTEEAVDWVASRIRETQNIVGRRIAVENISYYATVGAQMSELEFINAVLEKADCLLLLDVNNIYVNSVNHRYDPHEFLAGLPADRIAYIHVAGHYNEAEDLIIDTHGAAVIDPVWQLLAEAYQRLGAVPTLLERDFNFPPAEELLAEVSHIRNLQHEHAPAQRQQFAS